MKRQPVDQALVLDQAEQPRLPVVAHVVTREQEPTGAARENSHLVAADSGVLDPHRVAAVDHDRGVGRQVGRAIGADAFEHRAAEIDGDVVATDDDRRRPAGELVRLWRHQDRAGDDHPRLELDDAGPLRKRQH